MTTNTTTCKPTRHEGGGVENDPFDMPPNLTLATCNLYLLTIKVEKFLLPMDHLLQLAKI